MFANLIFRKNAALARKLSFCTRPLLTWTTHRTERTSTVNMNELSRTQLTIDVDFRGATKSQWRLSVCSKEA